MVEPIVAIIRGDHELNETKLANAVKAADLRPMTEEEIAQIGAVPGYGSPIGVTGATVVIDDLVASSPNLVAGANEEGYHFLNSNHGRDYAANVVADIIAAERRRRVRHLRVAAADDARRRGRKHLQARHPLLGAVGATFLGPDGQEHPVVMGGYGIGLDRLLACAAEEHHDAGACACRSPSRPRRFTSAAWVRADRRPPRSPIGYTRSCKRSGWRCSTTIAVSGRAYSSLTPT